MSAKLNYERAAARFAHIEDVAGANIATVRRAFHGLGALIGRARDAEQIKAVIDAEITVTLRRLVEAQ